jgi:very-short-patch-repair endonuclease
MSTKWNDEKLKWLKVNYNKTYKEMCEYLDICDDTIRVMINELGLKRTSRYRPFKLDMSDVKFLEDLDNPRLTAPDIVDKYKDKYGIGESRIHQLRKDRGIKLQINTLKRVSRSEKEVMNILDLLDVVYQRERRVGKYHIDFYLGFRLCIEVQGHYWHSKKDRQATDKRKKAFLEKEGYKILYLWDNDLVNAKQDIIEFMKIRGLPIS